MTASLSMSQRLQDAAIQGLGQLYGITSSYNERHTDEPSSRRRLAAATAASVLGASFDRLRDRQDTNDGYNYSDNTTDDELDGYWLDSDFEGEDYGEERTSTDIKKEKSMSKRQNHFIDILMGKLLVHAVIPDKKDLEARLNDPIRKETESLSIPKFTKNLRKMTAKLGGVFKVQYFIVRIFHWTQPSLTISALIIYTFIVLHPTLIFILPLICLLYGIMMPGYIYRHPIHKPKLLKVKQRGESLLEKFSKIEGNPKLAELVEEEKVFEDEQIERSIPELNEKIDTNVRLLKKNMEFLVNMRDLQNSLTNSLRMVSKIEKFWYGTAGFKDERVSTSLFFTVFLTVCFLIIIGPYIPWRLLLITIGWNSLIMIHPKIHPQLLEFNNLIKPQKQEIDKLVRESERKDIILDEPPEVREVEIFEIFKKSVSSQWEFFTFSKNVFDNTDQYRRAQKPPPGVESIDSVNPPKSWKFEDDEPWNIDYECEEWCQNRGLRLNNDNFIDAHNEFYIDDEFKRRRLFRNVIRYSRPARKPTHAL